MQRILSYLFLLTIATPLSAAPVKLQYQVDAPVVQTHELVIDILEQQGDIELKRRLKHTLTCEVSLVGQLSAEAITAPPFELQVVLRRSQIELQEGDEITVYDTHDVQQSESDMVVAQLRRLMLRPYAVHVTRGFEVSSNIPELARVLADMPQAKRFFPPELVKDLLSDLFLASGRRVEVGSIFERDFKPNNQHNLALPGRLTITKADYGEIEGSIQGEVPLTQIGNNGALELSATVIGKAAWTRRNALLTQLELHHTFDGTVQHEGIQWPVKIKLSKRVSSERRA